MNPNSLIVYYTSVYDIRLLVSFILCVEKCKRRKCIFMCACFIRMQRRFRDILPCKDFYVTPFHYPVGFNHGGTYFITKDETRTLEKNNGGRKEYKHMHGTIITQWLRSGMLINDSAHQTLLFSFF